VFDLFVCFQCSSHKSINCKHNELNSDIYICIYTYNKEKIVVKQKCNSWGKKHKKTIGWFDDGAATQAFEKWQGKRVELNHKTFAFLFATFVW